MTKAQGYLRLRQLWSYVTPDGSPAISASRAWSLVGAWTAIGVLDSALADAPLLDWLTNNGCRLK